MIRTRYQQSLEALKKNIVEMGDEAQKAINMSAQALKYLDMELADKVIEHDEVIDEYDLKIEKCVSQLIARENPTAGDMRLVTSCLKISIDIERMSDLAADIAKVTKRIQGEHIKPLIDIPKMAEIAENMLKQSIIAFETLDCELAKKTALEDDKIDELFYATERELIEMMAQDKTIINNASHLLFVLRYLERIGDHACNICESVVYMGTSKRVDLN